MPLDELLIQATCAILLDGQVKGTAWLIDAEGLLLTAGHVLGEKDYRKVVQVQFPEDNPHDADTIEWCFQSETGLDFAVLKIREFRGSRRPLPVSLASEVSGDFRLHGYGVTLQDQSVGKGEFIGPYDPQNSPANRLFRLRSPELGEGGYSGGAVFSETLQAVVGVQVEAARVTTGAGHDTILAMPLYRIARIWPTLEAYAAGPHADVDKRSHGVSTSHSRTGSKSPTVSMQTEPRSPVAPSQPVPPLQSPALPSQSLPPSQPPVFSSVPMLPQILPGRWEIRIGVPVLGSVVGDLIVDLFPNAAFQGQLSAPDGVTAVSGRWQIGPMNQLALQGQQTNGFVTVPYAVMVQFNLIQPNQLTGVTGAGEQVVWRRLA